jgi:hypothetical protein
MRLIHGLTTAIAAALLVPTLGAQTGAQDPNASVAVKGGGITAPGWTGKMDDSRENAGLTLNDARFAPEGAGFRVTTGPSATYWNPANKAAGTYTVKATFNEPSFMNINTHAHPYGIAIAGNDLGTPTMSILYCAAYGDGRFIVRGFGPQPFQLNGGMGESNAAIHKAAGKGSPVSQEIAVSVKPDKIECSVNGTVVGSYDKAAVVAPGKLKSTDGVYGLRFGHNTDVIVSAITLSKQ